MPTTIHNVLLIPYKLTTLGNRLFVHWLESEALDLQFGFFRQSVRILPEKNKRAAFTSFDSLLNPANGPLRTGGIVVHTSRCGSTLLCQVLKQHPKILVLGEPVLCNQILRHPVLTKKEKVVSLRNCVGIYDRWAQKTDRQLLIKFSSWNLLLLDLIREATPWPMLCLYRHFLPVLLSMLRKPPAWLSDESFVHLPLDKGVINELLSADLLTRAAYSYLRFAAAIEKALIDSGDTRVLEYQTIICCATEILKFFKFPDIGSTTGSMISAARIDSKTGGCFIPHENASEISRLEAALMAKPNLLRQLERAHSSLRAHPKQLCLPDGNIDPLF